MVKGIWKLDPQGSCQVDLSKTLFPLIITLFNLCQELRPDPSGSYQVDLSKTLFPLIITLFNLCQELRPDPLIFIIS